MDVEGVVEAQHVELSLIDWNAKRHLTWMLKDDSIVRVSNTEYRVRIQCQVPTTTLRGVML